MKTKDTILLIHGFGNNFRVWDQYIDFFQKNGFDVVAPNLRFHAPDESILGLENVSLVDYVDDLGAVIKTMKAEPIIMGYSMGGLITLKLLERGFGKMGICLAPAAPRGINALSISVLRLFFRNLLVWRFWKKVHAPRFSAAYFGALGHLPRPDAQAIFDRISSHESGRVGAEIGFPVFDPYRVSEVDEKKIKCPVLVIGSYKDKVTPVRIARSVAKKLLRVSDYKEYSTFGHWLMTGKEFSIVSDHCLLWIQDKLAKN
jgi:pimeloyl-ACP methyl ester carboxylesterase